MKDSTVSLDFGMYDDLSIEAIEALRQILECEQSVPFTFEEAKEIGTGLLKLFEVLAEGDEKQDDVKEETQQSIESGATVACLLSKCEGESYGSKSRRCYIGARIKQVAGR